MVDRFNELLDEIRQLHNNKGADYGDGDDDQYDNLHAASRLGISPFLGVLLRMSDKFTRIQTITRKRRINVCGETVTDTLLDLAVYSLLAIQLYEEEHGGKASDYPSSAVEVDTPPVQNRIPEVEGYPVYPQSATPVVEEVSDTSFKLDPELFMQPQEIAQGVCTFCYQLLKEGELTTELNGRRVHAECTYAYSRILREKSNEGPVSRGSTVVGGPGLEYVDDDSGSAGQS